MIYSRVIVSLLQWLNIVDSTRNFLPLKITSNIRFNSKTWIWRRARSWDQPNQRILGEITDTATWAPLWNIIDWSTNGIFNFVWTPEIHSAAILSSLVEKGWSFLSSLHAVSYDDTRVVMNSIRLDEVILIIISQYYANYFQQRITVSWWWLNRFQIYFHCKKLCTKFVLRTESIMHILQHVWLFMPKRKCS